MEVELSGDGAVSGGGAAAAEGGGGGAVVVVGVKLDEQSKELLTWALLKVAQPGDLVIALHVLDSSSSIGESLSLLPCPSHSLSLPPSLSPVPISLCSLNSYSSFFFFSFGFAEGTSSLMSSVNAFDSILAVYEGFCNLKQVAEENPSKNGSLIWSGKTYYFETTLCFSFWKNNKKWK